ncbi:MAG: type II toxin-antitoxin system RelE/ParE family toxin [Phycisphaerales bacterium JB060]
MSRTVLLTDGAARDLDEAYATAYDRGGTTEADLFLDRIQDVLRRLGAREEAGVPMPELARLGLQGALQLRFGDDRLVYRVQADEVRVALIAPASRSMQALLTRRLLDG